MPLIENLRSKIAKLQEKGSSPCEQCTTALQVLHENVVSVAKGSFTPEQLTELDAGFEAVKQAIEEAHGEAEPHAKKGKH